MRKRSLILTYGRDPVCRVAQVILVGQFPTDGRPPYNRAIYPSPPLTHNRVANSRQFGNIERVAEVVELVDTPS